MGKSKMNFDQIPVTVVKRIAQEGVDDWIASEDDGAVPIIPASEIDPAIGFRTRKKERVSKKRAAGGRATRHG
jgi:hypothetical protein